MKNINASLMFSLILVSIGYADKSHAQDYFTSVLSNIKKGHALEAVESLGAYKSTLLGCLMNHQGSESACKDSVTLAPTENFNYEFISPPKDKSNAWSIKATGKNRLDVDDTVVFSSDEGGRVSCKASGKIVNAC